MAVKAKSTQTPTFRLRGGKERRDRNLRAGHHSFFKGWAPKRSKEQNRNKLNYVDLLYFSSNIL